MSEERDRLIERALERRLSDTPAPAGHCLDAETAAAWVEGVLGTEALGEARRHVADCSRCQALMATLLDAEERPATVGTRELRAGQAAARIHEGAPRRWRSWAVGLATAATLLVAAVVWFRTSNDSTGEVVTGSDVLLQASRPSLETQRSASASLDRSYANTPAAPTTQKPASPPPALARQADAAAKVEAPSVAGAAPAAAARAADALTAAAPADVTSPNPDVRWRIVKGSVQKTVDRGATWLPVPLPTSVPIAAAAASSPTTCWAVGEAGTVLVTVDGATWRRVPFPETVDLIGVVADARGATVIAADGRRFETRDAGASWTAP